MLMHVLVPLDGSKFAEQALDAVKQVAAPDARVTLLTSIQSQEPPLFIFPGDDGDEGAAPPRTAPGRAQRYLEHLAKNLKLSGYRADAEVGTGDAAELIVDRAYKRGADAIILTSHGRSGLSRVLFGSVTLKVLALAPCLVVVVPNRQQERVPDAAAEGERALGMDTATAE